MIARGERDWSQIRRQLKSIGLFQFISSSTGYTRCGSGRHAEPIGFIIATITNHLARKGPPFPCQQRSAVSLPTKVRPFPANKGPPFPCSQRVRRFPGHKGPPIRRRFNASKGSPFPLLRKICRFPRSQNVGLSHK
jgi:hypothetical protein